MSSSLTLREVPPIPFSNIPFDIHIHLLDDTTGKLICGEDIPLEINLLIYSENDSSTTKLNEFLTIGTNPPILPRSGSVIFSVTITTTSMIHANNKFILEIVPVNHPYIKPIRSDPMFVVTHELIIEQFPPQLWYKDQGGRDNYIDIRVRLVDHRHVSVTTRRVPLKATLYYENGVIVPKQDILKVEGDLVILERRGEALIRFRIEEVSRSHQRQKFVVRISPDTHLNPRNNDINPVETPPIEVMSKPKGGMNGSEKNNNKESNNTDITSAIAPLINDKSLLSVTTGTSTGLTSALKKRQRHEVDVKLELDEFDMRPYSINQSDLHLHNMGRYQQDNSVQSIILGHQKLIEELLKMNQTMLTEYVRYSEQIKPLIQKLHANTHDLQIELNNLKRREQIATSLSSSILQNNNNNNNNENGNDFPNVDQPPLASFHSLMPPPMLQYPSLQSISSLPLDLLAEAANEIEGRRSSSSK